MEKKKRLLVIDDSVETVAGLQHFFSPGKVNNDMLMLQCYSHHFRIYWSCNSDYLSFAIRPSECAGNQKKQEEENN